MNFYLYLWEIVLSRTDLEFVEYLSVAVIDDEFAGSFLENDASDGALTAAGAYDCLGGESTGKPGFDVLFEVFGFRFGERGGGDCEGKGFGEAREGEGGGEGESVGSLRNVGRERERREGSGESRKGNRHFHYLGKCKPEWIVYSTTPDKGDNDLFRLFFI